MKNNFLILLLVSIATLVSCNGKNEESKENKENTEPVNEFFSVEIDAFASKTDDFAMYFSEDGTSNFEDINAKWYGINGGKTSQVVLYNLSEETLPTHVRLDFGLKNQDSVVVKSVKFDYYGNKFQFKGSDFFNYFIKDEQFVTKTDPAKGTLTILAKDGVYKTPYYYPTQLTVDKIKEITTKK
ncbi:hypothetical protein J2X31_002775 [Flavobacterium arsenatis]|uniref:Lipoprotein n=1 Tax=Flavobacterium arsenatis TaxID=1484332 RepID=A0ABU1TSB7_9FLAO|nr:hypothetical protein [Flavobacterium arsenatis]MDR6968749.1 hypothetical protein [Flavobacterium arsenatis]